jgi:co-chaperonin GroES (HSP10)
VVQDKTVGGDVGGVLIAAKERELHEGRVLSIGFVPDRYKHMKLRIGDTITFARFNAVKGVQSGEDWLFVSMQFIVCKKEYMETKRFPLWQKVKGWFNFSIISLSFAAGWFSVGVFERIKPYFKKSA